MADLASGLAVSGKEFYTDKLISKGKYQQYGIVPYLPLPEYEFWQHTTATEIARLVSMFEMSCQGINTTINIFLFDIVLRR